MSLQQSAQQTLNALGQIETKLKWEMSLLRAALSKPAEADYGPVVESIGKELNRVLEQNDQLKDALRQIAFSQLPVWHRDLAREVLEKVEAKK